MNISSNIRELIDLAKKHSELPIIAMVDGEIVGGDDYCRWLGCVGNVKLGEYALHYNCFFDEREEFKERYYDRNNIKLREKFGYEPGINEYTLKNGYCTRKRYEENKKNEKRMDAYLDEVAERAFKAAIIINIDLPDDIEVFEGDEE